MTGEYLHLYWVVPGLNDYRRLTWASTIRKHMPLCFTTHNVSLEEQASGVRGTHGHKQPLELSGIANNSLLAQQTQIAFTAHHNCGWWAYLCVCYAQRRQHCNWAPMEACATIPGSQTPCLVTALFSGTSEVSFMAVNTSFVEREKEKVLLHRGWQQHFRNWNNWGLTTYIAKTVSVNWMHRSSSAACTPQIR